MVNTRMTRRLTFSLALWQSAAQDGADRIQAQEVDCAISDYTNLIESNPNNSTTYFARGAAHLKAFNFDSAIADFTKAIELEQTMTPPTPTGVAPIMKKLSSPTPSPT